MPGAIALIGQISAAEEATYLSALTTAMPGETVVPFRHMSPAQRTAARIAIVADPDPADVAALANLVWVHSLWVVVERLMRELGAAAPPRFGQPKLPAG